MEKFRLDRPDNDENTARVVAARQNNVLLLWRATLNYTAYYERKQSMKLHLNYLRKDN